MRMVLIVFLLVAAPRVWAQSPEEAYIAARVQTGAVLEEKSKTGGSAWDAAYDQAKSNLEAQLRRLMGPVRSPKGFSGAGTFSPEALCCGLGEGMLDGILFRNGHGSVLVTTENLLRLWLQEHKNWWKDDPLATNPKTAFQSSAFYTQAISSDAAVSIFAPLPIRAPGGASLAVAGLATQCNGSCSLPQYIAAAVVKGGRVYVALVDAALPAPTQGAAPPGACDAVWKDFYDRYKAAYAAYEAAKESSKAYELLQAASRIETEGGAAVDKCRKSRAPADGKGDAAFPGLTRRAQDLADGLAAG
ncbi:MAG: hypothetical protein ACXWJS_07880 [Hyphomicrobium sp.]